MKLREESYGKKDYIPQTSNDLIEPGCYFLKFINDQYQRFYEIK